MKTKIEHKIEKRKRRHARVRSKISGTLDRPRLSFFKSSNNIYAQIIDDTKGHTLVAACSLTINEKGMGNKADNVGMILAKAAVVKKIIKVVFDRGGFKYSGVVARFADSARKNGLEF